ncbi:glycosyltransferase [Nocardioides dubius]|uniref:Glycosyl transferase family 28 C-terminal domain-containing protein n=1 Tax=Nocardioides dubius TaxID=317019 RepID=A0ABN1TLJ4_9ACTN
MRSVDGPEALVVVLVGTDHHPFDRLVEWSLSLADEGWSNWYVQYGTSHWPQRTPGGVEGATVLGIETLTPLLGKASAVITHAGPGLLMDAQLAGHTPVVVPRDPARGEHVDDHQQRFVRHLGGSDRILPADSLDSLRSQVRRAMAARRQQPVRGLDNAATVARFTSLVDATVQRRQRAVRR